MIPGPNFVVLVSHSSIGLKRADEGIWRDFSVFKGTNVVGKFATSYFNYVSRFCLMLGSNWRQNMWNVSTGKKHARPFVKPWGIPAIFITGDTKLDKHTEVRTSKHWSAPFEGLLPEEVSFSSRCRLVFDILCVADILNGISMSSVLCDTASLH